MYSQYAEECNVQGRPMVAQTMEFISDMGTIFQSCMKDEITVDEFCEKSTGNRCYISVKNNYSFKGF